MTDQRQNNEHNIAEVTRVITANGLPCKPPPPPPPHIPD